MVLFLKEVDLTLAHYNFIPKESTSLLVHPILPPRGSRSRCWLITTISLKEGEGMSALLSIALEEDGAHTYSLA